MMIYIDLVILLNFIFDLILLVSVNYILRRNVKTYKLILGSLLGSVTLLILFIKINNIFLMLFKVFISVVMIIVTFGYKDIKYTGKNIIYFYLVSMLLGGGIEFLNNQFNCESGVSLKYLIVLVVSLIMYFIYMKNFKDLKNNYSNYYNCKIFFNDDNYVVVNAFLDTGNKLKDPYSNKSIILIDKDKINNFELGNPLFVPYHSLNNHGLLTCYKGLKIEIDGKYYDKFLVGISNEHFFMDGIDCIINNLIMEGLR